MGNKGERCSDASAWFVCAERDAECGHAIFLPGSRVPQIVPGTSASLLLHSLTLSLRLMFCIFCCVCVAVHVLFSFTRNKAGANGYSCPAVPLCRPTHPVLMWHASSPPFWCRVLCENIGKMGMFYLTLVLFLLVCGTVIFVWQIRPAFHLCFIMNAYFNHCNRCQTKAHCR